ncbi:transient receptor potential cation channel subfamily A member 1 homolog [Ruditapes philippinarum]|uniref:transient receptor potential cation channel subfamily A member 1 homolog n=1 Tax=Ruditapes philippinarum TaxID=129788 RepID=UPI00295A87F2|nr:transient receptor potential cation channel subfamily A member 1 homolog [Ruditapes philippinarum]
MTFLFFIPQIYHIVVTFGLEYFKQFKNFIKWTAYTTALPFLIDLSECENTPFRETWQWILGTVAIFMAWVDLLSYVEKFDLLGIYVSMLKRITKTFIRKIFPIVLIFLIAFTLAFLCARKKQDEFKDFWVALLSISAMMADGFGYEDHSDFHIVDTHKYVVVISHLISSIFLIMIAIILMNLMVNIG